MSRTVFCKRKFHWWTYFFLFLFSCTEENLDALKEKEYIICVSKKVCECNFVQKDVDINKYQRFLNFKYHLNWPYSRLKKNI